MTTYRLFGNVPEGKAPGPFRIEGDDPCIRFTVQYTFTGDTESEEWHDCEGRLTDMRVAGPGGLNRQ
jgi:hypothetical protein